MEKTNSFFFFFGRTNRFSGEQTRDGKVCDNVYLYRYEWSLDLIYHHKLPLEKGSGVGFICVLPSGGRSTLKRNLWQPYFPVVAAFSPKREALRRL